jgi:hypothetical protein
MHRIMVLIAMAVTPAAMYGSTAYVAGGAGEWGTINLSTGQFNLLGTSSSDLNGVVVTSADKYLGYDALNDLVSVNPLNGALTLIGSGGVVLDAIAIESNGSLFGFSRNTSDLYSINPNTGATAVIGSTGLAANGGADSFTSNGTSLFLTYETGTASANLYTVNAGTGAATLVGNVGAGGPQFEGSGFIGGQLYEFGTNGDLYTLTTSGPVTPTLVGAVSGGLSGGNAAVQVVPEPSTLGLLCGGGALLFFWKKRRPLTNVR